MKRKRVFAFLKISLAIFLLAIVGLSTWLRIEQYRFRRKAEALLADMRTLQIGRTTEAEAMRIAAKWSFERYDVGCKKSTCSYGFDLKSKTAPSMDLPFAFRGLEWRPSVGRLMAAIGARPAVVLASFEIGEGVVIQKGISLMLETAAENQRRAYLAGSLSSASYGRLGEYLEPSEVVAQRLQHSTYVIQKNRFLMNADTGGTGYAKYFSVQFTSDADQADVERLSQFNLDCLTRLSLCTVQDFMPASWYQWSTDRTSKPPISCTAEVIDKVASFADLSGIYSIQTAVVKAPYQDQPPWLLEGVSLVKLFGGPKWRLSDWLELGSREIPKVAGTEEPIQPGQRYIFLIQDHIYGGHSANIIYPCGILKVDDKGLALAKKADANIEPR